MRPIRTVRLAAIILGALTLPGRPAESAANAPYVSSYETDNFFSTITSNEMEVLRTKKILFLSRSFGLNLRDGLARMNTINPMYNLLNSYVRYDIPNNTIGSIPGDAFSNYNFVHVLATFSPLTKRLDEMDTLLRDAPYSFGNQVDVVMVFYHTATWETVAPYTNMMNRWKTDFPAAKFICVTSGYGDESMFYTANTNSTEFGNRIRAAYKGNEPLYDLGYILNNDGACGDGYCPEYSDDPAGVHPNSALGEERLGKAFLLMMRDLYFGSGCTNLTPPTVPVVSGAALSSSSIHLAWPASTHECGISRYEVTRNGTSIGSVTRTNYTDSGLTENTAYNYAVRAVSMADVASAYSSTSTVTTLADSVAPTVIKAAALAASQVSVEFSENMDSVSAQTATNYAINCGGTVLSASLSGKTVTLTTSALSDGTNYTLTLNHVADGSSAKNPIAAGSEVSFVYLTLAYPEDPIACWNFNGTLNDSTTNALNATWVGAESFGNALLGRGLVLSGATNGSYAQAANNALLGGMPQLTVSVWARKSAAAAGGSLFMKSGAYYLTVNDDDLKVNVQAGTNSIVLTPTLMTNINNTNWHHYAVVYNGTNAMVYVDGTPRSTKALTGNILSPAATMAIGKNTVNAPYSTFAGDIDEMKIFRRALSTNEISALISAGISGSADRAAVRTLLDANNLTNKQVDAVSVYQNDRITKLYIQEGGVSNLTSDISRLSELETLHLYGDRELGYPLLTQVAPEIGSCSNLTVLLLNQNNLTNLPAAITNLTKLTTCSIGDNLLCGSYPWENWANTYDPDWRISQNCAPSLFYIYSLLNGPGSVFPSTNLAVGAGQSTQVVYSADSWHEITGFTGNGATVPSVVGATTYTAVFANVSADITNQVTFAVTKAPADGQTPATWYGPLGANPSVADEDQDSLSLNQEYLINSHPAQSNTFRIIASGLDAAQRIGLSWQSLGLPNGQVQIGFQPDLLSGNTAYPSGTTVYSNGICTWRSDTSASNDTGFMKLKISSAP